MIPLAIATFLPFDPQLLVETAALVVLLLCSALASGSETSMFSLRPAEIEQIRNSPSRSNAALRSLLSSQDYLLATILIANNLVNICIVILSNRIINRMVVFEHTGWEFLFKTVVVTFLLLLFGEIMPKVFATYNSLRFARTVALPLRTLRSLFRPLSWILVTMSRKIDRRASRKREGVSIDELSGVIAITADQTQEEKKMLTGIVSFAHTEVEEIMTPRIDIVALENTAPYSTVRETIIGSGFSRIPVYADDTLDHIEGILYVKDMLPFADRDDRFEWQRYLRKPYFVPEHKRISDLLEEFRTNKVHVAIVVDEYGSTQGLVSLEDILEEIVGEISDESDVESKCYTRIDENTYSFEGKTHLGDFARVMGLDETLFDDVRGEAETLAGLMLEIRRDFLRQGEKIFVCGLELTVESLDGRRIDRVRVVRRPASSAHDATER